jgi:choline-glycine betaine transporter
MSPVNSYLSWAAMLYALGIGSHMVLADLVFY